LEITLKIAGKSHAVNLKNPLDISVPLNFNGEQPNVYDAEKAVSKAVELGSFIGDTRRGGSCNFEQLKFIPHCNGTHTECIGHISNERIAINDVLKDAFIPSVLITIEPENAEGSPDTYDPDKEEEDKLITLYNLREALKEFDKKFAQALIIRTLPNDESKKNRRYMDNPPPFFSLEAMNYINELGVKHLLVDIPSVDRAFDEGKLSAHHIYWNVKQGSHDIDKKNFSLNTITEMIYVPGEIKDGYYLLNLQVAAFQSDASPSRPLLYKLNI
jgi:kynurenine formamidase